VETHTCLRPKAANALHHNFVHCSPNSEMRRVRGSTPVRFHCQLSQGTASVMLLVTVLVTVFATVFVSVNVTALAVGLVTVLAAVLVTVLAAEDLPVGFAAEFRDPANQPGYWLCRMLHQGLS